jgi:hypothetical protein
MLSVTKKPLLSVVMLSVILLSVVILSVVMLECRGAKQSSLKAYCDSIYLKCCSCEVKDNLKGDKLFIKRGRSFQKHSLVHQSMASLNGPVQ